MYGSEKVKPLNTTIVVLLADTITVIGNELNA